MLYIHWIFLLLYVVVIGAVMIAIVTDDRQPAKTMAWLLVLWFLPVVGIILYIFFGQNIRKHQLISSRSMDQLTKRSMLEYVEQRNLHLPENQRPLMHLFAAQSNALPFKDNEIEIYTSGYEFFPALLKAISTAKDHIHLDTFIFADDALGYLIADALIDKAEEGVEVRVLYDDMGSWHVKSAFFERMRDAGIEVHAFMPVKFPAFTSKANYRNHRKLCVVDGRIGFIGGMNIALRYVKGTGTQPWRDTHLKVVGGGVYGIQRAFLIDWYFCDRTLLTQHHYYPDVDGKICNDCLMQVVTSSPISPWPEIMQGYVSVILQARKYVYIETPYFLPTEPVLFALSTAALTGVDVRIMVPMHNDSKIVGWASMSYVSQVSKAGVKVYLYKSGFNHSKLMVVDDLLSTCGSTNVDVRSFEHNFESNAFIYDKTMAERMSRVFVDDQQQCVPLEQVRDINRQPFFQKLWESIVRLLSPLL